LDVLKAGGCIKRPWRHMMLFDAQGKPQPWFAGNNLRELYEWGLIEVVGWHESVPCEYGLSEPGRVAP
jgi:hypothetical protein